jgi:type 1 glutamine amidotransferase
MAKVLVLSGSNHAFDKSAPLIAEGLPDQADLEVDLEDDKAILASTKLRTYDVLVHGSGFTYRQRQPDGTMGTLPYLSGAEEKGLFDFVRGGKGLVGIHGTAWWIGGEAVNLVGGHANWHPPGLEFGVHVEDQKHPITRGLEDFTVQDEIYMSAWDPAIHVLATATWSDRKHPMAWTHAYGKGKVFFTTLGHGPNTFENQFVMQLLGNACAWAAARS